MFLDENAVPFTGGTYFPPQELQGRPSFNSVLENVSKVYQENRDKILNQADQMKMVFRELNKKNAVLKQDLEPYVEKIINYTDEINGGFKGAPKFPQFYIFDTILHFYNKTKNKKYLDVVEKLLLSLSSKGIYDHLEGGISRYTVDEKWIVPHFEKMLYDNIQYVNLLNNYLSNKENNYLKQKLIQTIKFINSEFIVKNNLLGSAYDADSDGIEGKYYVWKYQELKDILGNDLEIFKKKYQISEQGNFEASNILVENLDPNISTDSKILEIEQKLLEIRKKRNKPFFDDKTQLDLNSLMLSALVTANEILPEKKYLKLAEDFFSKIEKKYIKNKIYHSYSQDIVFIEDYAFLISSLIDLSDKTMNFRYKDLAKKLLYEAINKFYLSDKNIFQKNPISNDDVFFKPIDIGDNTIPNGNAIMLINFVKLGMMEEAKKLSESLNGYLNIYKNHMMTSLRAIDFFNNINKGKNCNEQGCKIDA